MRILIVGDVFSKLGRASLEENLPRLRQEYQIDFTIVNGENTSHGKGINENHYKWMLSLGVDAITLGNHSFHNKDIYRYIDGVNNIIRPCNYINDKPGKPYQQFTCKNKTITVFQVLGQVFMQEHVLSPFEKTEEILQNVPSDIYICDFHGEATSEKIAFAHHFDGRIHIIYGTHTHVQTNDARILPKGTAFITDVGMTGPHEGVIGVEKEIVIARFLQETKHRFTPQNTGKRQFNGIIIDFNEHTQTSTIFQVLNIVE